MSVEDIRWTKVSGYIRKHRHSEMTDVVIRVKFDDLVIQSRAKLRPKDLPELNDHLDAMVKGIDNLFIENGVPPYQIRSQV